MKCNKCPQKIRDKDRMKLMQKAGIIKKRTNHPFGKYRTANGKRGGGRTTITCQCGGIIQ